MGFWEWADDLARGQAGFDAVRQAFVYLPVFSKLLMQGKAYTGTAKYMLDVGATAYMQLKIGENPVCFWVETVATDSEKITLKMHEDPSLADGVTPVALINRNRESPSASSVVAYSDPTNVDVTGATQIDEFYAGGTVSFKGAGGEQLLAQVPLRLKPNEDYLISITNDGTAQANVMLKFIIVED